MKKISDNIRWVLIYMLMALEKFADSKLNLNISWSALDLIEKIYDDLKMPEGVVKLDKISAQFKPKKEWVKK